MIPPYGGGGDAYSGTTLFLKRWSITQESGIKRRIIFMGPVQPLPKKTKNWLLRPIGLGLWPLWGRLSGGRTFGADGKPSPLVTMSYRQTPAMVVADAVAREVPDSRGVWGSGGFFYRRYKLPQLLTPRDYRGVGSARYALSGQPLPILMLGT